MSTFLTNMCYTFSFLLVPPGYFLSIVWIAEINDHPDPDTSSKDLVITEGLFVVASAGFFFFQQDALHVGLGLSITLGSLAIMLTSVSLTIKHSLKRDSIFVKGFLFLATVFLVVGFVALIFPVFVKFYLQPLPAGV